MVHASLRATQTAAKMFLTDHQVKVLFSVVALAIGMLAACYMFSSLVAHINMRGWEEVPAEVVSAALEVHQGEFGDCYKTTAQFTYDYHGHRFNGDRVCLSEGYVGFGTFQQRIYRELDTHRKSGRAFRCYVNPNEPAEAILYRDLQWEVVAFWTLFAAAPTALGLYGLASIAREYLQARRQAVAALQSDTIPY